MKFWAYYCSKFLCWLFFRIGFGLEVQGAGNVPKSGAFILASNHLSFLDPPVLGAACPRPVGFMARDTLFRNFLLAAYMRSVRVIPLKRGESDIAAIRLAIARLTDGDVVCIFPEGTRGDTPQIRDAKRGVDILAKKTGVPVIPVFVQGTFEALPRHRNQLKRSKIRVAFGTPIAYTERPLESFSEGGKDPLAAGQKSGFSEENRSQKQVNPQSVAECVTIQWRELAAQLSKS